MKKYNDDITLKEQLYTLLFLVSVFFLGFSIGIIMEKGKNNKLKEEVTKWCENQEPILKLKNSDRRPEFCKK